MQPGTERSIGVVVKPSGMVTEGLVGGVERRRRSGQSGPALSNYNKKPVDSKSESTGFFRINYGYSAKLGEVNGADLQLRDLGHRVQGRIGEPVGGGLGVVEGNEHRSADGFFRDADACVDASPA